MKIFIILLLSLYSCCVTAQTSPKKEVNSIDVYYGYRPYFQKFYDFINTSKKIEFNKPLQVIGIGTSGEYPVNRKAHVYGHLIYNQVVPQSIHIQDTIHSKISGFMISMALGGALKTKSGVFSLYYYAGINAGRLRIYGNEFTRQKNGFFSPKFGIHPKLKLGKLAISLIVEANYDITNPNWKRTWLGSKDQADFNKLRQSGITGQLGLGYVF